MEKERDDDSAFGHAPLAMPLGISLRRDPIMSDEATHTHTTARYGFFPIVAADSVTVRQAGVTAALSSGDMSMIQGGGNFAIAGGNLAITMGGSNALLAGGDVSIEQGGALLMGARSVSVRQGFVGAVVAANVELEESRVLLTTPQAAALGAALGFVVLVIGKLFRRG